MERVPLAADGTLVAKVTPGSYKVKIRQKTLRNQKQGFRRQNKKVDQVEQLKNEGASKSMKAPLSWP